MKPILYGLVLVSRSPPIEFLSHGVQDRGTLSAAEKIGFMLYSYSSPRLIHLYALRVRAPGGKHVFRGWRRRAPRLPAFLSVGTAVDLVWNSSKLVVRSAASRSLRRCLRSPQSRTCRVKATCVVSVRGTVFDAAPVTVFNTF